MPYIWGGVSDGAQTEFGVPSRGGYDCSGFVWRVYKLEPYAGGGTLSSVLRGRTTYEMSAEVPRSERIGLANLEPADVIFFGDRGPRSKPSQVGHMGIYVGNGWFVQSSGYGVALARLDGWYAREFAWARRPLAEADLSLRSWPFWRDNALRGTRSPLRVIREIRRFRTIPLPGVTRNFPCLRPMLALEETHAGMETAADRSRGGARLHGIEPWLALLAG